jgi:N-acetylglucosaminyldiphosphoundecaprenol N-acetyl-beta-D-mannosaminyltransferase
MNESKRNEKFKTRFIWIDFLTNTQTKFQEIFLEDSSPQVFHFVAASSVAHIKKDRRFSEILNHGNSVCDSRIIELLSSTAGPGIQRMRGSDFLRKMFRELNVSQRHLFVGSTPEVMGALILKLDNKSKTKQSIDYICPEFNLDRSLLVSKLVEKFDSDDYDYIWIALGSPKQDYVASEIHYYFNAKIFCIGAAVDFVSGMKSESPHILSKIGLEWLYRLINEPRRLLIRYTLGSVRFLLLYFEWVKARKSQKFMFKIK